MMKVINVREGFSRKDDKIPARWLEPLKTATGEELRLRDATGRVLSMSDID